MTAPALPMNIINELILQAAVLNKDEKFFQLRFNRFSQTWEMRWFFRKSYQRNKKFLPLTKCLRHKLNNPPEVSFYSVKAVMSQPETFKTYTTDSTEEIDAFIKTLSWGLRYEFPSKTRTNNDNFDEETFVYTYIHFEDGQGGYNCAFIEENSCEDSLLGDYWTPLFHRAYVSINGDIFPFFKEPQTERKYYPWNEETKHYEKPELQYYSIDYLNRQRGMRVKTDGYRDYSFKYFDQEKQEWNYESFTPYERRMLVPYYESSDEDDGYYNN
jgi:hypothetical protein